MQHTPAPIPSADIVALRPAESAAIIAALPPVDFTPPAPKATVSRADLAGALKLAASVVERRSAIPILDNAMLRDERGLLQVFATDIDMAVRVDIPASIVGNFALTAPARMLEMLVRKSGANPAVFDVLEEPTEEPFGNKGETRTIPGKSTVRLGTFSAALRTLPAKDMPQLELTPAAATFTMPTVDLCRALERVQLAISTEETRYYLNGVFLKHDRANGVARYNGNHGTLCFAATDGHRLAEARVASPQVDGAFPDGGGYIIPRKLVAFLLKALGGKSKRGESRLTADTATIAINDKLIVVSSGNMRVESKLIQGTFPDYLRVIPTGNDKSVRIDPAEFSSAVDRVTAIAGERGRAVKLSVETDRMHFAVNNPDSGTMRDATAVDYNGPAMDIGFNAVHLLSIFKQFGKIDAVELLLADPGSPILVRNPADRGLLYVLMPMRV